MPGYPWLPIPFVAVAALVVVDDSRSTADAIGRRRRSAARRDSVYSLFKMFTRRPRPEMEPQAATLSAAMERPADVAESGATVAAVGRTDCAAIVCGQQPAALHADELPGVRQARSTSAHPMTMDSRRSSTRSRALWRRSVAVVRAAAVPGANFITVAALVGAGDDVWSERPT
jgi:hypothetical protein